MTIDTPLFWFLLTLSCILIQMFFSMLEMAAVSYNKVRLQYFVEHGQKSANLLHYLLDKPSRLFGTTLLGVNISLQLGSECSRQFYSAMEFSPELAPLTQVILVLLIAEIAPMFAARRYPEHVVNLGISIVYASSIILKPVIWGIEGISHVIALITGADRQGGSHLRFTREDLQGALRDGAREPEEDDIDDLEVVVSHIFSLRGKTALEVMVPIHELQPLPATATISRVKHALHDTSLPYIPIYQREPGNIIGIARPADFIRVPDSSNIQDCLRSPWFITQDASIYRALYTFRRNSQSIAIVLDDRGRPIGILTVRDLLDEIFGELKAKATGSPKAIRSLRMLEKSFPGKMLVEDFNQEFEANLDAMGTKTIGELLHKLLGHDPEEGESARIGDFKLTLEKGALLRSQTIIIKSILR